MLIVVYITVVSIKKNYSSLLVHNFKVLILKWKDSSEQLTFFLWNSELLKLNLMFDLSGMMILLQFSKFFDNFA